MAVRRTRHGRSDLAVLLLGFALAARRSELRLLDWTDLEEVEEGLAVEVWRPKVNHEGPLGVPYGSNPATCPVRAVRAWRQCLIEHGRQPVGPQCSSSVRAVRPARAAARVTESPMPSPVIRRRVSDLLAAPVHRVGDAAVPVDAHEQSGRSLRRGFATAAKQAGADL